MSKRLAGTLEDLVGGRTYEVWCAMLQALVPEGRTHRIAPFVAGLLQYSARVAYDRYGRDPEEGSLPWHLFYDEEPPTPDDVDSELAPFLEQLFADAGVECERVNARGDR